MSSEIKKKKYQGPEEVFDIKTVVFPFALMPRNKEEYIYTGEENIPFRERHPVYRDLFLGEFEIWC